MANTTTISSNGQPTAQPDGSDGASAEALQHHYDLSNEFYELWLDSNLLYTCALFAEGDTLETAQARKVDYLLDAAGAQGVRRALDVGCGWGSMMRRMVDGYGVHEASGVTLSPAQREYIEALGDDRLKVFLEDWADHEPDEPYDAIVAAGVMEHAVKFGRPRSEKVDAYRKFLGKCHSILKPGGGMALQTIAKGNVPLDQEAIEDLSFISTDIFPESDVPRFSEVAHAAEKKFEIKHVRNDRRHYVRTCGEWHRRLVENREAAVELVGEHVVEQYERFLLASTRQFAKGQLTLLRFTLRRVD
jgi:cyclopropane-fatty-acyl-phospholipid synthase